MDGLEEMTESLNQTTQGLKASSNLEEIIGIIRSELYTYFANMNAQQKQMVVDNKEFIQNLGKELKRIIGDENKKSELLRGDIRAYLENNNRLFKESTEYLKEISVKVSKPVVIPPPIELPKIMFEKLDRIAELLEKTHQELEGLDFRTGVKVLSKSNVAERLAHKFKSKSMLVIAEKTNSNILYLGSEGVGPHTGTKLNPGESIQLDSSQDTREIWLYGTKGDSVNFVALCYKPKMMTGGSR